MKAMKTLACLLAALLVGTLAACTPTADDASLSDGMGVNEEGPGVSFLSFKPEQDAAYQEIAAAYTKSTGVPVTIRTAAGGTYDSQLAAELSKTSAPTIFEVSGPVGFDRWKGYAADLSDSELYSHLTCPGLALTGADGDVYAIPFVTEGYGIIVNTDIMEKYFATEGAKAKSLEEINSFEALKQVAEDMQAKKDELGIEGAFAATSLEHGEDWRWNAHLMNVALYYEWQDGKVDISNGQTPATIQFSYADRYKQLFDLFLNNSTLDAASTPQVTTEDSMTEFALGKAAMVQNGDWAHSQIDAVEGNVFSKDDNLAFLPLYIGAEGEESQGLCIGSENYFCINKYSSEEDQQASLDFLTWLYTSEEGVQLVRDKLGFAAPFDTFGVKEGPENTLGQLVQEWNARTDVTNIPWDFTVMPNQRFRDDLGACLQQYALGSLAWEDLVSKTVADWAQQAAQQ